MLTHTWSRLRESVRENGRRILGCREARSQLLASPGTGETYAQSALLILENGAWFHLDGEAVEKETPSSNPLPPPPGAWVRETRTGSWWEAVSRHLRDHVRPHPSLGCADAV